MSATIDLKTHLVGWRARGAIDWRCPVGALCGTEIADPVMLSVWDSLPVGTKLDLRHADINLLRTCGKCFVRVFEISGRETIYAVKSAKALRVHQGGWDE